jgi:Tol biopolymer transport system component/DNA-binding winged helix-turn-helix (wHTH) protein
LTSSLTNVLIVRDLAGIAGQYSLSLLIQAPYVGRHMAQTSRSPTTIRFGAFEADLLTGELRKSGIRIKLQDQPFKVLVSLLEQAGEVVTREELRRSIWPDGEFGDFDHAVNIAVAKLRTALNDSADQPRFVETLARRGYRFIGTITPPATQPAATEPSRATPRRAKWRIAAAILAVGVICAAVALVLAYRRSQPRRPSSLTLVLPFTALPGDETSPAFSPDGSRIAFAWNGDPDSGAKGFDLYVKAIGGETVLRLTHHPSDWLCPAWSPDGTQIAFHRLAGADTGVYVVPVLGGPERKLHSTRVPYSVAAPISWSADGKWIAFGDPLPNEAQDRIFLLSMETLEVRQVPHNPKCLHEGAPVFSHKGNELAYVCVHSMNELELYSVSPWGGAPRRISAVSAAVGFSWSADDSSLVISELFKDELGLAEINLKDGSSRRLDFAETASWPTVSLTGEKLAYSSAFGNSSLWRLDLRHPQTPAAELIKSTQGHEAAEYSPDGRQIAFISSRAGPWDLWMSDADGGNLVQLSRSIVNPGNPRWSPDGTNIAFDSSLPGDREIYVVDVSGGVPKRLATNLRNIATPSWSRDGKWIYFRSYEALGEKIYRCAATGGNAVALGGEFDATAPQESFDESLLYFAVRPANTTLSTISLTGDFQISPVEGLPPIFRANLYTVVQGGIYFVPADAPRTLRYFDFASRKVSDVFHLRKDFAQGLSVSPDGRWLLYSQVDDENSDIMLVDHFN